jgi:hypothetical protein
MRSKRKTMSALKQLALIAALAISVSAQRPDRKQIFVPPDVRRIDSAKLQTVAKLGQLSPARKLALLKTMPDINPGNASKTTWTPFFRLTPRSPFTQPGYWYFSAPAVYTPHWYDDEGVALFVNASPNSNQMVLLFSGQPNQAYAIDVTMWVNDVAGFRFGYAVDGTPVTPKERKFNPAKPEFQHLIFDLPASTSGEYEVAVTCIDMKAWWAFYSLEVGALQ